MPDLDALSNFREFVQRALFSFALSFLVSLQEVYLHALTNEIGDAAPLAVGEFRERAVLLWL
jgi:hypothetical protein